MQTSWEIVFERVLKEGGTALIIIPVNTGNEKPPQKNWSQSKITKRGKLSVKAEKNPIIADMLLIVTYVRALGSVYPPILLNINPPKNTPHTGPVIAIEANDMNAVC